MCKKFHDERMGRFECAPAADLPHQLSGALFDARHVLNESGLRCGPSGTLIAARSHQAAAHRRGRETASVSVGLATNRPSRLFRSCKSMTYRSLPPLPCSTQITIHRLSISATLRKTTDAYDEDRPIDVCARTASSMMALLEGQAADRRACPLGAGASIPKAAALADAMPEDREAFIVCRSSQPRGFGSENFSQKWSNVPVSASAAGPKLQGQVMGRIARDHPPSEHPAWRDNWRQKGPDGHVGGLSWRFTVEPPFSPSVRRTVFSAPAY